MACKRQILFHTALNFSSDCPHPTAKFALIETKFAHFRLQHENPNTLLDEATIRDLQEKYPEAEVSLEIHPDRQKGPLSEQHFWEIIAMLDWTKEEDESIETYSNAGTWT